MPSEKFDIDRYITGDRKDLSYSDMSGIKGLGSEQVRKIAIERAMKKNPGKDLVTIQENTKGELEIVKFDIDKRKPIILSDAYFNTPKDIEKLKYNNTAGVNFANNNPKLFAQGRLTIPTEGASKEIALIYNELLELEVEDIATFEKIEKIQRLLGFKGKDVNGRFDSKTQQKFIEIMNAPVLPEPVPLQGGANELTPPQNIPRKNIPNTFSEAVIHNNILNRLGRTQVFFENVNPFYIDPNKVSITKNIDGNYQFTSTAFGFDSIQTPIVVDPKGNLMTSEVIVNGGLMYSLGGYNGTYTLDQIGDTLTIRRK